MNKLLLAATLAATFLCGCTSHKIQTSHEVKPIHITMDINIKIQNDLKKKFGGSDETYQKISDEEASAALDKYLAETDTKGE